MAFDVSARGGDPDPGQRRSRCQPLGEARDHEGTELMNSVRRTVSGSSADDQGSDRRTADLSFPDDQDRTPEKVLLRQISSGVRRFMVPTTFRKAWDPAVVGEKHVRKRGLSFRPSTARSTGASSGT